MTSDTQSIFDGFVSEDSLQKLVTEKVTENLYLEFKEKSDASVPDLSEGDKKHFSDALSQFANSAGGVLIFGVKSSKPNDEAVGLSPINDAGEFHKRLIDYARYAVQPTIDGIQGRVLVHDAKSGYVIFHVPQSDKTPHRSMTSREYYRRGQNGKQRLEHYDLENMFGRRQKPNLLVLTRPRTPVVNLSTLREDTSVEGYLGALVFDIFVSNEGRYIAKHSMAVMTAPSADLVKTEVLPLPGSGASVSNISGLRADQPTFQINSQSNVYYPEVASRIATLYIRISIDKFDELNEVTYGWEAYAEDMALKKGVITLPLKSFIDTAR